MSSDNPGITTFFWLMLIAFIVALAARRARVPYALALVITGLALGATRLVPHAHLEPRLLFTVFLPPLLFESALNLRARDLWRDWKPIVIFTVAGTLLSTLVVGELASRGLSLPLAAAFVFGALISPADPISVMAIFRRLGAGQRLTLILGAESLFNDAIAVVLLTVALRAAMGGPVSAAFGDFFRLVFGGAAVGAAIGLMASRVYYDLDDHLVEITLTSVVAFGSYLCAEALGFSGVTAVVSAGLVIGNLAMRTAMGPGTQLAVMAFWEYAVFVVNSVVFLLIGIEVARIHWLEKLVPVAAAIGMVLAGRSGIYLLSAVVNRLGGNVPRSWQHVLFWGGLRGALCMALALGLGPTFPQRDTVIAATFGVVLFSLLVQGLTIRRLIERLGLAAPLQSGSKGDRRRSSEIMACEAALAELARLEQSDAFDPGATDRLRLQY